MWIQKMSSTTKRTVTNKIIMKEPRVPKKKSRKRGPPPAPKQGRIIRKIRGVIRRGKMRELKRSCPHSRLQRTKFPPTKRKQRLKGTLRTATGWRKSKKRRSLKKQKESRMPRGKKKSGLAGRRKSVISAMERRWWKKARRHRTRRIIRPKLKYPSRQKRRTLTRYTKLHKR